MPSASDTRLAVILFAAALLARLLFWQATPDAGWPHSAALKGDAAVWLEYAQALQSDRPFELDLPFRPPGAAYLIFAVSALGVDTVQALKSAWCLMGALLAPAVFMAARPFGRVVAGVAGGLVAISTGLLVLSTSLDNETPYLLLAAASLWLFPALQERPRTGAVVLWSALQAVACLFRVEHLMFVLGAMAALVLSWSRREETARWLPRVALVAACFLVALAPWQASAWKAVTRFNHQEPRLTLSEAAAMEAMELPLAGLAWTADAQRLRQELPAFARRTAADFVAATVAHRGGRVVRGEDFRLLEEAFGYVPRPLSRPFVALYGPLNFALANHAAGDGGFNRALLEAPPLLEGGAHRYPVALVAGLPPPQLAFIYPPHLRLVNEGYAIGLRWASSHPGHALSLVGRKLHRFWSGAALGLTGYGLPLGLSGWRAPVDMVVPIGGSAVAWRLLVLLACGAGLWNARRRLGLLLPWMVFLLSRLAAALLFFGYARLGASAFPVVALLIALAMEPVARRLARPEVAAAVALVAALAIECVRFGTRPQLFLDARDLAAGDPFPLDFHQDQRLEVR